MNNSTIFGIECELETANTVLIPVPWDVTTSYGRGTRFGPEAILKASPQLDLLDYDFGNISEKGIHYLANNSELEAEYLKADPLAREVIKYFEENAEEFSAELLKKQDIVNAYCQSMVEIVYKKCRELLKQKKIGIVGGDHSSPLGFIQALSQKYTGDFGILHIDAHADLRKAYQGFTHSHASIMYNCLQLEHAPKKLIQVGIRDYCQEEKDLIDSDSRVTTFFGPKLNRLKFQGNTWQQLCDNIVKQLPNNVYISFDIDGLSPEFCPNTGTPVPGGLSFAEAEHLLRVLKNSNKSIIGFDLCEVAPGNNEDEWDGNVGARILYKLCGLL